MEEQKEEQENETYIEILPEKKALEEVDEILDIKEKELEEKVEAALFIAGRFLSINELVSLTDVNPIMLREILYKLEKKYSSGAIIVTKRNEYWKMDVNEKYHYIVQRLASGKSEFTKAEQETLAVIAHKQPIKQSVVIRIRGNKAYDHIKKFLEMGLVNAKKSGHTYELFLTENFYEYFNIEKKE